MLAHRNVGDVKNAVTNDPLLIHFGVHRRNGIVIARPTPPHTLRNICAAKIPMMRRAYGRSPGAFKPRDVQDVAQINTERNNNIHHQLKNNIKSLPEVHCCCDSPDQSLQGSQSKRETLARTSRSQRGPSRPTKQR